MKLLVPGRFTTTSIKTPDGGELEIRLTDGGHWQMKAKLVAEKDWRPSAGVTSTAASSTPQAR